MQANEMVHKIDKLRKKSSFYSTFPVSALPMLMTFIRIAVLLRWNLSMTQRYQEFFTDLLALKTIFIEHHLGQNYSTVSKLEKLFLKAPSVRVAFYKTENDESN